MLYRIILVESRKRLLARRTVGHVRKQERRVDWLGLVIKTVGLVMTKYREDWGRLNQDDLKNAIKFQ